LFIFIDVNIFLVSPNPIIMKTLNQMIIFLLIFLLTSCGVSSVFNNTFRMIEREEIKTAQQEIQKVSEDKIKNSEDLAKYVIANTLLISNPSHEQYNPYKALEFYNMIETLGANKNELDRYLFKYGLSLENINQYIYQRILNQANAANTKEAYHKALSVCNNCFYEAEVTESIEYIEQFDRIFNKQREEIAEQQAERLRQMQELARRQQKQEAERLREEQELARRQQEEENKHKNTGSFKDFEMLGHYSGMNRFPKKHYNELHPLWYSNGFISWRTKERIDFDRYPENIISVGKSGRDERFEFTFPYLASSGGIYYWRIPNINHKYIQSIRFARTSYDNSLNLAITTDEIDLYSSSVKTHYFHTFEEIFFETGSVFRLGGQNIHFSIHEAFDFKLMHMLRLSNNNILLVFENKMEYLSHHLSSAFGIDGYGNISRTFKQSRYYKFLILSPEGERIIVNKNYLLPLTSCGTMRALIHSDKIASIDGGFILVLCSGGSIGSLNKNDFGIKRTVFSQSHGRDITVTENIRTNDNFSENPKGFKIVKFDNNASFEKEISINEEIDPNIQKPEFTNLVTSENYFCISYNSYSTKVMNVASDIYVKYDFNLKEISRVNFDGSSSYRIYSKNDYFYVTIKSDETMHLIPFNY
jgi:hypothetical protein